MRAFILFLLTVTLFSSVLVSGVSDVCDKEGSRRLDIPGRWAPPPGTDPQWLNRNATTEEFIILGAGSISIGNQVDRWGSIFSIRYFDFSEHVIYYESGFSYFNDLNYTENHLYRPQCYYPDECDFRASRLEDFMLNERYPNATERALFPSVQYWPIAIQPIVFTYNYTSLKTFVGTRVNESIYLTVSLMADIYLGVVNNWNDTRIRVLNPMLSATLPNQTIVPIGYSGFKESSTRYVSEAFWYHSQRFRDAFPNGPFDNWPAGHPSLAPNLKLVDSAYSTFSFVRNTPGGIGYMNYQVYTTSSAGARAVYALLRDEDGNAILPEKSHVMKMFEDIRMNSRNELERVDYNRSGWPFNSITYLHVNYKNNNSLAECLPEGGTVISKDRLTLMFFEWVITNPTARKQGAFKGVFIVPDHIVDRIVDQFEELTCPGRDIPILVTEVKNDHKDGYFEALLILSMVITGVAIPLCSILAVMPDADGKRNLISTVYSFVLLGGALITYLSIVFFYLVPDERWICQMRIWFVGLGFSLFLGAIFTRTLQIYRIFRISNSKRGPKTNKARKGSILKNSAKDCFMGIGVNLAIQFAILGTMSGVDPFDAVLSTIDEVLHTASWVCKASDMWIWLGLEIGFFVTMLLYGGYVVYRTWSLKAKFDEGRWLLICVYNMICTMAVLVAIGAAIVVKDDTIFIIAVAGILFTITSSLFFIFVPKFQKRLGDILLRWRTASDSTSSKNSRSASRSGTHSGSASPDSP